MIMKKVPIESTDQIVRQVNETTTLKVTNATVRSVLKAKMGCSYRMAKKVPIRSNSERCMVLRQKYALVMLDLLNTTKRVINVDESWLNDTSFQRKVWAPIGQSASVTRVAVSPRLSLIAALDTDGRVWYSLT